MPLPTDRGGFRLDEGMKICDDVTSGGNGSSEPGSASSYALCSESAVLVGGPGFKRCSRRFQCPAERGIK